MLNAAQITQQIAYVLFNLAWPGGGEKVLGRVGVTPVPAGFLVMDGVAPFALVTPGPGKPHPELGTVVDDSRWTVALLAEGANDQQGGSALVGANVPSATSSRNRGLLAVAPLVLDALLANCASLGVRPRAVSVREVGPTDFPGVTVLGAYEIAVTRHPMELAYHPVRRLKGAVAAGTVTLTWGALPDRYDLSGVEVYRDGVLVQTLARTATTFSESPAAGAHTYTVTGLYQQDRDPLSGSSTGNLPVRSGYTTPVGVFTATPAAVTVNV